MLSVANKPIMLGVIMLNVVVLSDVAPLRYTLSCISEFTGTGRGKLAKMFYPYASLLK